MKNTLLFSVMRKFRIRPHGFRNTRITALCSGVLILSASALQAQTSVQVPDASASVSGAFIGPYANAARTYQMIIDDSQLTALSGKYLTSISFRLNSSASANWPATDATYGNYDIYLSDGVEPANRQLNFAANVVGTQTQVRAGVLTIPAGAVTAGSSPNAFSYDIVFDTPYQYTGTNLVIEIRHTGSNSNSTSVNAMGTSSAGYGTLFTACWEGTNNIAAGNFAAVKINSVDNLGVKSVEIESGFSIYPNPVREILHVDSDTEITEIHIYNMAGQKVYSQKERLRNPKILVQGWAAGTYVIQTLDKNGNSASRKFIKH